MAEGTRAQSGKGSHLEASGAWWLRFIWLAALPRSLVLTYRACWHLQGAPGHHNSQAGVQGLGLQLRLRGGCGSEEKAYYEKREREGAYGTQGVKTISR